ncbi:hypothetical protein A1O3_02865 [Capronia epimyces CBS 606.96]|uniref:Zn(2)-C6 fungal-type domain-containing protein n=1 Tax=Capronia epimyces CBS 606.96 TaxID=1182542 RepID=W9YBA0_9EURO|nr:uncharacterized protein A1O3_02865 [Capronia epimyces CBS 606.96]EXJ89798.1 hypothetical protein A1O3_02865 [Capronia epimyces CBS 606.96]
MRPSLSVYGSNGRDGGTESTLKRHGYYCRSRRAGSTPTPRTRSCIACARRKARCDNQRPECSRCISKAIECHYPTHTPKSTGLGPRAPSLVADAPPSPAGVANGRGQATGNGGDRDHNHGHAEILNHAPVTSDPEFAYLGADYLDWNDPSVDFADFLHHDGSVKSPSQSRSSESSSWVPRSTSSTGLSSKSVEGQLVVSSPNLSIPIPIPISTLSNYALRSFIQRPKIKTGHQRIANLILHTLKSYPLMMLRDNTLPPFIHPHLISSDDVESNHTRNDMEPLTNCINLVRMISGGVRGSRKLFWKNVGLECERMYAEHLELNKWELLAAMQALSIYILIRMDEGETDHNNYDFQLVAAVTVIAQQLGRVSSFVPQTTRRNAAVERWRDWVYEESRQRLAVVYRVVNMLVYFEPASMCTLQTDLVLAPLPAKKQLWEARDESEWTAASERDPGSRTAFGLAANGELVKLDEGQLLCGSGGVLLYHPLDLMTSTSPSTLSRASTSSHWEEWCAGMDGFGGLVMLAASLIA